ncbi:MAG: hypothetical protein SXQ77_00500 [Halobacteria archaeon]|nr:hypothetical protein [Halobacteria archaeon]
MLINDALLLITVLFLAAAVPLSVIAARGFWNAPFGKVMKPLPIVFTAFLVSESPKLIDSGFPDVYYAVITTVGVLAAVWAALQATMLLTERRDL